MIEMTKRDIIPAVIGYITKLADSINTVKATGVNADTSVQAELLQEVSSLLAELKKNLAALEKSTSEAADFSGDTYKKHVCTGMMCSSE